MELSIIIPVYNVEKYIGRCLESIYSQQFSANLFEVIVVDDGTPDNSITIVKEFMNIYKNLTLINQHNQGLSIARNNGLAAAKGKYVWFVDSDDWIEKDSLQVLLPYLKQEHALIATNLKYTHDDPSLDRFEREVKRDVMLSAKDYISNYSVGASQRYVIQREFLEKYKLKFYPGILHEDAEFNLRLVFFAEKVLLLQKALYSYYQGNTNSIMTNWKLKNSEHMFKVYHLLTLFRKEKVTDAMNFTVRVYAFKLLLDTLKINGQVDFYVFYKKIKITIRKEALNLVFTKEASFKQRVIFLICLISPKYFKILQR